MRGTKMELTLGIQNTPHHKGEIDSDAESAENIDVQYVIAFLPHATHCAATRHDCLIAGVTDP